MFTTSEFKIIHQRSDIRLSKNWTQTTDYKAENSIVNKHGELVTETYQGRKYRLISKMERSINCCEKFCRGFIGMIAALISLGLFLSFKSVRQLLSANKYDVRYALPIAESSREKDLLARIETLQRAEMERRQRRAEVTE